MYCACVLGDISFIYYWRSHVRYMCVRGYQFYLLLQKSCTVYVCQGISVLFTIGEVMYCICVLGDISCIYYWISHVLYMCVRGYQFYLLLEKSCTVYVCQGISVVFTIGEVMYCTCVLEDISFIYYWRSHVLYMCIMGYQFYLLLEKSCTVYVCQGISVLFYYSRSRVLYMCVRGYQFYLLLEKSCTVHVCQGISVVFTNEEVMYCTWVLGDISCIYYWRSHVLYMCVRGFQFYLLLEKSCTVYVCQGISVLFPIGEVMYCICVLGDISFIYYWRSHVLYMCVKGYQFYLLLETSCTVHVCQGISVLFTLGEVMYCICVLWDISFIYYWRSHVLYMCVRGYQFYFLLEKSFTVYVCKVISVLFTIGEVMYCACVLGDISFIYYWRSHVLYMCVRGYQFYLLLEKSCTVYVCQGISVLFTIGEVMYCICVLGDISFISYWRSHLLYMCVK